MKLIRGDQLRGHMDSLILAALEQGPAHGWEIWHSLEAASGGSLALKEGSLYPALYRLENERLISARWESAPQDRPGPRRRVYSLTAKGRRRLDTARSEWQHFVTVLSSLLGAPA